MLLLLGHW
jgi:hypothetical protein